jgi:hypothetical protein
MYDYAKHNCIYHSTSVILKLAWQSVLGRRVLKVEGWGDKAFHASSFGQTRAMKYTKKYPVLQKVVNIYNAINL